MGFFSRRSSVSKTLADTTDVAVDPMSEVGATGLKQQSGLVMEEFLPTLKGDKALKVYREMGDNDAIVGSTLFALRMWLRAAEWGTKPASVAGAAPTPQAIDDEDLLATSMDDMSHSWATFVDAVFTEMPQFGRAYCEVVYKVRQGDNERPGLRSRHDDGAVGWRKIALRSAESFLRWEFDDENSLRGMWQQLPANRQAFIPIEKALLFRTTAVKENPEGRSALRAAYRVYWLKKRMEEVEGIGAERQMVGFPVVYVQPNVLTDASKQEAKDGYEALVKDIRIDEQAGVVLPAVYDDQGNQLVKLELLSSPGSLAYDTSKIIERHSRHIAMSVLADVILLGHEKVGTQSLAVEKSDLLTMALTTWLTDAAEVLNRHEVPRLMRYNGRDTGLTPIITVTPHESVDLPQLAEAIGKLAASGAPLWPNPEFGAWLSEKTGIPLPEEPLPALAPPPGFQPPS